MPTKAGRFKFHELKAGRTIYSAGWDPIIDQPVMDVMRLVTAPRKRYDSLGNFEGYEYTFQLPNGSLDHEIFGRARGITTEGTPAMVGFFVSRAKAMAYIRRLTTDPHLARYEHPARLKSHKALFAKARDCSEALVDPVAYSRKYGVAFLMDYARKCMCGDHPTYGIEEEYALRIRLSTGQYLDQTVDCDVRDLEAYAKKVKQTAEGFDRLFDKMRAEGKMAPIPA